MRRNKGLMHNVPHKIYGKGWTVMRNKRETGLAYCAIVHLGHWSKTRSFGYHATREEAVHVAISAAFKLGVLDWEKTVRWCKLSGIPITYDAIRADTGKKPHKGWYVSRCSYRAGGKMQPYWQVRVGRTYDDYHYCKHATTKRMAVGEALDAILASPTFNLQASLEWLDKHDLGDLAKYFKRKAA